MAMRNLFTANSKEIGDIIGTTPIGREVMLFDVSQATNPKASSIIFVHRPLEYIADDTLIPRDCCILLNKRSSKEAVEELVKHNAVILTSNPRLAYAKAIATLLDSMDDTPSYVESHGSWIARSASIGENVHVEPGCFIDSDVRIGDGTVVMSGASVRRFCTIGKHSTIGPNSVIGSDGFGFERDHDGTPVHLPHVGGVEVGNYVYVGASATIACGTIDPTRIGDYVKINNLVHIAHNCDIGGRTMIGAGATVCGSVVVGERVWIGAGAAIKQSCKIGTSASIGLGAVIVKDVRDGDIVAGNPARLTRDLSRMNRVIEKLAADEILPSNDE
jgi:UDP-3-O-[3-hydroxymyristoyl] glucosamine N-acyltransferase LpxD